MIKISIRDFNENLELHHLVLDYNGTLATDGEIEPGVISLLNELSKDLTIHVITADTFGKVKQQLAGYL